MDLSQRCKLIEKFFKEEFFYTYGYSFQIIPCDTQEYLGEISEWKNLNKKRPFNKTLFFAF